MKEIITTTYVWEPEDGKNLKDKREFCHLSIRDVEALTGIGSRTVCRYEVGPCKYPNINLWKKLNKFYDSIIASIVSYEKEELK